MFREFRCTDISTRTGVGGCIRSRTLNCLTDRFEQAMGRYWIYSQPLNWDKSPGTEWSPYIEANTKFHCLMGNSGQNIRDQSVPIKRSHLYIYSRISTIYSLLI